MHTLTTHHRLAKRPRWDQVRGLTTKGVPEAHLLTLIHYADWVASCLDISPTRLWEARDSASTAIITHWHGLSVIIIVYP